MFCKLINIRYLSRLVFVFCAYTKSSPKYTDNNIKVSLFLSSEYIEAEMTLKVVLSLITLF